MSPQIAPHTAPPSATAADTSGKSRIRRFGSVLVAVSALAATVAMGSDRATAATSLSIIASQDAPINESSATTNYGKRAELRVRDGSKDWRSLMQFDVTGLTGPAQVSLRLTVTDASSKGGSIYAVASDWNESSVSWSTAPKPASAPVALIGAVSVGQTVEIAVGTVPGNGRYAFLVAGGANNSAVYASRESATPPKLIVIPQASSTTNEPTTTAAPTTTTAAPTTTTTAAPTTTTTAAPTTTTTAAPTTTTAPPPPASVDGVWVDPALLASRPMSGAAWNSLKARADGSLGTANISDQNSNHDINTLAVALVAARTGNSSYRAKAEQALLDVIGTDDNADPNCSYTPSKARAMSLGRNLLSYVVAADVLGFRDPAFVAWVNMVRFKDNCPNTGSGSYPDGKWLDLSEEHNSSGSNGSSMAGASRIAAAAYLGDTAEVERAWATFRRYAGDRSVGPNLTFNSNGLTWSHDSNNPVAVNPAGSTKSGQRIDGAIINDIGRGGAFTWPPGYTQYQWEGAAGFFAQAQLLAQAGYPAWGVQNQAPRRVVEFSLHLSNLFGSTWWDHSDWVKYLANRAYGLQLPINGPADEGKNMAWTDWVFGP